MDSITHREMRNSSGEILRRVAAGESVQVTNRGVPAAVISPIASDALDDLIARGEARAASVGNESLLSIQRSSSPLSSAQLIKDSRGPW